ncbi:cytochrome b/b6 domain-containing protein [Actibacterium sp. D379-3]
MRSPPRTATTPERVRLWDPLLRLFHWALAVCVIVGWGLGKFGPDVMTLHFYFGYAVIGLLGFRLVWGLIGPGPARFSQFLYGPRATLDYARHLRDRTPSYWPGHNPLGAISVFVLLGLLVAQVATGLVADPEDYINVGPLADRVSTATSRSATAWHETLSSLIALMVVVHVAAIAFYKRWKGEDLIRPMITGWKQVIRRD